MRKRKASDRLRQMIMLLLCSSMLTTLYGCGAAGENEKANEKSTELMEETDWQDNKPEGDKAQNKKLHDKASLYTDDETSVVTMYLTVSSGNSSDNTDHTWTEINSYSVYDYNEMGVDRYAVNGLLQVGDENGPVEGELGYGQLAPNATVTIRGQTSSRYSQKNYKISIKDGKGTWNDQKVINLNKHQQDITRFSNKMCYDIMKDLDDMISLRTQFVHLYVKDTTDGGKGGFKDYGLYTQVEQLNKRALQSHGLDKNGQLYKINFFEFYRYDDVIMLKNDADYDQKTFERLLEIKGDDDHSKLIAMLEDVNDYSIPIEETLDKWFEEDNLLSWLAFQILIGNTDTQSRNSFLYSPLNEDTFYFIAWDCDGAFIDTKRQYQKMEEDTGWEKGISNYWGNILFQRVLKSDTLRAALDEKIEEYRGVMTEELLSQKARQYAEVVEKYAYSYPDSEYMPVTRAQYDELVEDIPSEVERNYTLYQQTLDEPMPFFIGTPEKTDEGIVIGWDASYDLNEESVSYTMELADDYSFTDPIVKEEGLFVPEYKWDEELPAGQYFVRVRAVNQSGREQYAFDYYVTSESKKLYGIKSFYVLEDGSIVEDIYEE